MVDIRHRVVIAGPLERVYPAIATETSAMDSHVFCTSTAGIAEVISAAKKVTDPFRVTVIDTFRFSSHADSAPPAKFPAPATTNGIHANLPIAAMSKCRAFFRYSGNQKM